MGTDKMALPDPSEMTAEERKTEIKNLLDRLKQLRSVPRSDWHRELFSSHVSLILVRTSGMA